MEIALIDIDQAAAFMNMPVDTIRNWVRKRTIPYYTIKGVRFKKEDLVAFVESKRVEPIDDKELDQKADEILARNENERKKRDFHK